MHNSLLKKGKASFMLRQSPEPQPVPSLIQQVTLNRDNVSALSRQLQALSSQVETMNAKIQVLSVNQTANRKTIAVWQDALANLRTQLAVIRRSLDALYESKVRESAQLVKERESFIDEVMQRAAANTDRVSRLLAASDDSSSQSESSIFEPFSVVDSVFSAHSKN